MHTLHLRFLTALAIICLVAACAQRQMWVPQAPGEVIDSPGQSPPRPQQQQQQQQEPAADASAAPAAARKSYTQARRYGDLWFLSGQIGTGAQIEEQTDAAMKKVASVLAERGLNLANVVQVTVYLKDINDLPRMEPVYEAHFRGELPARTVVAVRTLPQGAAIQISAIAGR